MKLDLNPDNWAAPRQAEAAPSSDLTYTDRALALRLEALLGDAIGKIQQAVLSGTLTSMDQYAAMTGELRGMAAALTFLSEAKKFATDAPTAKAPPVQPLYQA